MQLCRHSDRFARGRMRMDGLADIDRVRAHFDRERNLADEIARPGTDDGAPDQAVRLLGEDQLAEALVATVGDGASRGCPGKFGNPELDSLFFRFLLGFDLGGPGLQHDVVEATRVERLPYLDQVPVYPGHQAIEHLDHIQPGAEGGIYRAHFQADDAPADHEQALRPLPQLKRLGRVDDSRVLRNKGDLRRLRARCDDRVSECDDLAPVLRFYGKMVRP